VLDVLNRNDAVDVDKKRGHLAPGGMTWYPDPEAAVVAPAAGVVTSRPDASVVSAPALGSQRGAMGSSGLKVVQAHQEELRGGKRDVNPGRARIRTTSSKCPSMTRQLPQRAFQDERGQVDRTLETGETAFGIGRGHKESVRAEGGPIRRTRPVSELRCRYGQSVEAVN
jgi:hypothetical protein